MPERTAISFAVSPAGTRCSVAGMPATVDLRGTLDDDGEPLRATVLAIADDIAAGAGLVMGKTNRTPAVIVRGLELRGSGSGRDLIRPQAEDLFR